MPVLNSFIWLGIGLGLLCWFFLRDAETSRPWISHSQTARGEVLNVARTRGTDGIAFVYVRASPKEQWTKIASWFYVTDDENSPIEANWQLSRDGNLLCDGTTGANIQWIFDFSSRKVLHPKLNTAQTIADFDLELKRLIASHGALKPLKCQTWRASPWKWADTEAKQLLREEPQKTTP
ncbi:MAG TPA: hypothetical protein VF627_13690 [Abditibacterium sp.]|jgi:hypothetical protein